ncbi:MAG: serine protease [Gemmatimonadota bacterium]
MNRPILMAVATATCTYPLPAALAQGGGEAVQSEIEAISESVVRIRTIADLEYQRDDARTGTTRTAVRPYSVDGTGVVVGEMEVDGRTEYLILTNHHVADASNYVLQEGGYLRVNPSNTLAVPSVHETSYLMESAGGEVAEEGTELIELVRRVRGDMTLMRTSGATRKLSVFRGMIGYVDGEVTAGAEVVTSGYPWGGERIVAAGSVLAVDHIHELGLPHADFVLDLPVEPGQSGGPIFLVEPDVAADEGRRFRLIGLVHAKDRERNYGVPYSLWRDSLDEFPAELQTRLVR